LRQPAENVYPLFTTKGESPRQGREISVFLYGRGKLIKTRLKKNAFRKGIAAESYFVSNAPPEERYGETVKLKKEGQLRKSEHHHLDEDC